MAPLVEETHSLQDHDCHRFVIHGGTHRLNDLGSVERVLRVEIEARDTSRHPPGHDPTGHALGTRNDRVDAARVFHLCKVRRYPGATRVA